MSSWNDPALHELASEFFREFSRMEYALKAAQFLVPDRRNAEAYWASFAVSIDNEFSNLDHPGLKEAKEFLLAEPPKKQINENGQVRWNNNPPDAQCETELLVRYVCRVRNNLFHGGKFNGRWFEPERSGPLIEAGLVVLRACRVVSPSVEAAFHG